MNSITVSQLGKVFARASPRQEPFTALDDISFAAAPGDVVGIVGRNGAGKSTLLKILARILRPTRGSVELRGRVGSLLEVGTGFHPELTGRENIFLNAAILGMSRSEIHRSFDAIVDFAGTADHLDEPVKHYSSGMTMRLAFAVAAHVKPEILLMDEVLAVGDADFQRKCFERIEQVGRNGQTVLIVSHNIHAVMRLCNRAILLEEGRLLATGTATEVAARYLALTGGNVSERSFDDQAPGDAVARLLHLRICSPDRTSLSTLDIGHAFGIEMQFDLLVPGMTVFPSLVVNNEWGPICWTTDASLPSHGRPRPVGRHRVVAWFPANFLTAGRMTVSASLLSFTPHTEHFRELEAISFQALETAGGSRGHFTAHIDGGIRPLLQWEDEIS